MIKIDVNYLEQAGLKGLPDDESVVLLRYVYESLQMRVGVTLADKMSNEQLDEFEEYFEADDDEGAFQWLERNFPDYKDIVASEFDVLTAELRQVAPTILTILGRGGS